jgi:hypothetical protein
LNSKLMSKIFKSLFYSDLFYMFAIILRFLEGFGDACALNASKNII